MTQMQGQQGRVLGGRYRLERVLGQGGMAIVWLARDAMLGREVAIKEVVPPPELPPEERRRLRERVLREARAAARISSPFAVAVYDVVETDDRPWIVMQRLDAHSLADVLKEEGPLPPRRAAQIGLCVLDALSAAHAAGVLHRDVKPSNVMLTEYGRAVLTDFGIATVEGDPVLTTTGVVVGSPAYMAPERASGEPPTPASDLWSLGATLYAAVEGRSPFQREGQLATLAAVINETPAAPRHAGALAPIIRQLLSKDPAERPSAAETRIALQEAALAEQETAQLPAPAGRPAPPHVPPPAAAAIPPTARPPAAAATPPPDEAAAPGPPTGERAEPEAEFAAPPEAEPAAPPEAEPAAPPEAEPAAPPEAGPAAAADRPRRAWLLVALASVLLLGIGAAGLYLLTPDRPGSAAGGPGTEVADEQRRAQGVTGGSTPGQQAPSPTAAMVSPSPQPRQTSASGTSGTTGTGSGTAGTTGPRNTPPAAVPGGFRMFTDPSGFRIAIPSGWTRSRTDTRTYFREPGGRRFLMVDQTTNPKADALTDWQRQEAGAAQRLSGYQRIRIQRVSYRGWNAADWEFTWQPGASRLHVLNRNIRVSDQRAYALYWSVPESQWDESRSLFTTFARTFEPAR